MVGKIVDVSIYLLLFKSEKVKRTPEMLQFSGPWSLVPGLPPPTPSTPSQRTASVEPSDWLWTVDAN